MIVRLMRLLARMPLPWLHHAGVALGWFVYLASPVYAARMRENLKASGIYAEPNALRHALHACIAETGKGVLEIVKVWFGDVGEVMRLVECQTWNVLEEAQRAGRGVILLTPHLGCFEVAGLASAQRQPITVLYRPPRQGWLEPLMIAGRNRGQARVAPANLRGVRMLYKALQRGETIGFLPDQAPQVGDGVWAHFFGRPAYTMTLVRRLQRQTGAAVLFVIAERLPAGKGFALRYEAYPGADLDERRLNQAVEDVIRRCPTQYLWSYNRYKVPQGVSPPAAEQR